MDEGLLSEQHEQQQQQPQQQQGQEQLLLDNKKAAKIGEPQKVPQRPYGGTLVKNTKNNRLPTTVPIIGLGCSSFSTFFWPTTTTKANDDNDGGTSAAADGGVDGGSSVDKEQQQSQQQLLKQKFTPETIERNHPIVETWIETIKGK